MALEHAELDGIINLLDNIQDEAVSSGLADEETVFGKQETTWTEVVPDETCTAVLSKQQQEVLQELRHQGYAVIVWSPEELDSANPRRVEDRSVELGWDIIGGLK